MLGESGVDYKGEHILVTTPGFIKSNMANRDPEKRLDLSALKMVIFDEADELLI